MSILTQIWAPKCEFIFARTLRKLFLIMLGFGRLKNTGKGINKTHNAFQFDRQGRAVAFFTIFGVYGSLNKVVFPCLQLNFSLDFSYLNIFD
jgi:hypothetical protein